MTDVAPSIPRIAITVLAIVAVAVSAAGIPFDGSGGTVDRPQTPATPSETPQEPPAEEPLLPIGVARLRFYLFAGALGALALVSAVLVYRSLAGRDPPEDDPVVEHTPVTKATVSDDLDSIADAAGRAADRIQRGEQLDNEVYRAWKEMTDHLRIANRRARTPGEFRTAAVAAGMDPDDVSELTTLFEAARYGGWEPSEADERRAVELLRRIESEHGGDRT